ncbi:cupin domain-containing protein [Rhizoctonia solani]|nr:cupin domain-containing protein [Rhizoctonia solani]QRW19159.1 cupin domain-containing protein [Rhizoctonia solani]
MPPPDVSNLTPLPNPRRVVTANNPNTGIGEVLLEDTPQTTIGFKGILREAGIWTTNQSPADNSSREDVSLKPLEGGLVSPGGTNCRTTDLGPGQVTPMHRTNSIDYNIISRAVHVLEDGSEQEVGPGDIVVQRGTNHRWENRTNDWVRWVSVLVEAKPVEVNGKILGPYFEGEDKHP